MRGALLEHPLVIEVAQQLTAAEFKRLGPAVERHQALKLAQVDPHTGSLLDADPLAVRNNAAGGARPELAPQRRESRAQARAGTLVENVGPELRCHAGARVHP